MIKEITIDFSETIPQEILPNLIQVDIRYPKTNSLAILVIKNISNKWLNLKLKPKAATIEQIDLAPKTFPEAHNESMEIHVNRYLNLSIEIQETKPPLWYHGQEIPQ